MLAEARLAKGGRFPECGLAECRRLSECGGWALLLGLAEGGWVAKACARTGRGLAECARRGAERRLAAKGAGRGS